ncbi:MAG: hypothetical protein ACW99U_08810 [Candidatus Thorarchaeota archaeon]|jgi:hypothetical protein
MLMVYLTVGVVVFALGSYAYGFISERRHGKWNPGSRMAGSRIPHEGDPWSLVLFDCDFGASAQTNGPARTLSFSRTDRTHH